MPLTIPPISNYKTPEPPDSLGVEGTRLFEYGYPEIKSLFTDAVDTSAFAGKTFFVSGNGTADLAVSAGAINNVVYAGGTITAPANGDKVYIDATISGVTVTAVTVSAAASVPANTVTHVYKLLATVAVASSIATPTPVGWNFSEMQICAGSAAWGGFGA